MHERLDNQGTRCGAPRVLVVCLVVVACVAAVGGCRKPLFRDTDERSPYSRYDEVRGQQVDPYRFNEYGRRVPNLRARLTPKE
ncbi:MAG: hypothetical protein Phyf2KO_15270 [Phycisphaerales bacterium]